MKPEDLAELEDVEPVCITVGCYEPVSKDGLCTGCLRGDAPAEGVESEGMPDGWPAQ